ncbi:MAG: His/Gly/Thr/Pro-type tRNA ligase C-terminal domain-containing protein, partial [Terriglobales bacterium]
AHFDELRRLLEAAGIAYRLDARLVRGLDYYTSTAFEFLHGALGSQNALLGGGRYNGLAQALGAPASAGGAIGFALGEDRFVMAMQEAAESALTAPPAALVIPLAAEQLGAALALAESLRAAGVRLELATPGRKLGKSLELAAKLGARHALIVGASEVASERWQLKDITTGQQEAIGQAELLARLKGADAAG